MNKKLFTVGIVLLVIVLILFIFCRFTETGENIKETVKESFNDIFVKSNDPIVVNENLKYVDELTGDSIPCNGKQNYEAFSRGGSYQVLNLDYFEDMEIFCEDNGFQCQTWESGLISSSYIFRNYYYINCDSREGWHPTENNYYECGQGALAFGFRNRNPFPEVKEYCEDLGWDCEITYINYNYNMKCVE